MRTYPICIALVEGIDEVREAFRAVQAFSPAAAEASAVERIGEDRYVVRTATRYLLPLSGPEGVTVRRQVVVSQPIPRLSLHSLCSDLRDSQNHPPRIPLLAGR